MDPRVLEAGPPRGWRLALDRAPQFLSVLLLFAIPFLTQPEGTDLLFPKKVVTQVLVYLMACAWLLRAVLTGKAVIILSKALAFLSFFLLWSGLTLFFSPYPQAGSAGLLDFACFPLWYVLLTFTCLEAWRAENLLVVFLASGLGVCFWAIGQAFGMGAPLSTDPTSWGGGVMAGMGDPGNLAGYLQMVWPLALALYLRAKKPAARLFWGLLFFSALTALVLTGSGAGWAGLLAGSLLFAFFAWRDGNKTALKWLLPLAAVLYFYAFHSPVSGKGTGFLEIKGEKARVQLQIWQDAVEMIKDGPLLGSGFGTFAQAYPSYRSQTVLTAQKERGFEVGHARNGVLDSLAETGWVGFLLFIAFWFHVLAQWWKLYSANAIPKVLAAGAFAAFGAVAVNNLFDPNGHLPSTLVPLFFLAAFPVALSQRF
jgi:O-antigen ligase